MCPPYCLGAYGSRIYIVSRRTKVKGNQCLISFFLVLYIFQSFYHFRNSEKSQRSQLDLCVVVFRARSSSTAIGPLVEHSKRQVRGFVGCYKMLEAEHYILVCLAFNHWHTGTKFQINILYAFIKKTLFESLIF